MQSKETRIVWEYIVKPEYIDQFIAAYSRDGAWAQLFRQHRGYLRTELIRDSSLSNRFITIDHWSSLSQYTDMKNKSRKEYRALDEEFDKFSSDENYIGVFETL